MGEALSKATQPEDLAVFKKLPANGLLDSIQIPERAENRRPTDKKFLIVYAAVVVLLFPFLIYCIVKGDLSRLKGYDQCGNICGQKNSKYEAWPCTGQDYTDLPYLEIDALSAEIVDNRRFIITPRKCVAQCPPGFTKIFSSCYISTSISSSNRYEIDNSGYNINHRFKREAKIENLDDIENGMTKYLSKHAWRIVLACFVSLGVGIIMLVLFKTATAAVVWGILGGVLLFMAILVGALWWFYLNPPKSMVKTSDKENTQSILFLAIFLSIVWLVLLLMMIFMYRKILLVIQLLKESTKAAFAMPLLIFVPIITFIVELIILSLLVFFSLYIYTSGTLTEFESTGKYYYHDNIVMNFTFVFNIIVAFWSTQFIIGIQYMVIAGAVAKWYWSKNKNNLDSPISESASIVFKFHLGSVAFGSLVITIIAIIKALISSLTKNKNLKACVDSCIGTLESFLKFLSKNSYILTAMHGKPFYKSGKRAAKIIFQNAVNIAAVNYVGDFVLGMAQLLIVLISLLITVAIMQGAESEFKFLVYGIVFFVSLFIAVTFFATFETTIDTLFLCFCEDSLLNDGMARPYAMSRDLMEFVENSKKLYGDKH